MFDILEIRSLFKGLNMNKVPKVGDFGISELPQVTEQINGRVSISSQDVLQAGKSFLCCNQPINMSVYTSVYIINSAHSVFALFYTVMAEGNIAFPLKPQQPHASFKSGPKSSAGSQIQINSCHFLLLNL